MHFGRHSLNRYHRGDHYGSHYGRYHYYPRLYGGAYSYGGIYPYYGSSYYYPSVYGVDYGYASVGVYGSYSGIPRVYAGGVTYVDTVVVDQPVVRETYYTTTSPVENQTFADSGVYYGVPVDVEAGSPTAYGMSLPASETQMGPELPPESVTPQLSEDVAQSAPASPGQQLVEQGVAAFRAGRVADARRLSARAMLMDQTDGYAKLFYGLANFASGAYPVAASAFRRALRDAPELIEDPLDLRSFYSDRSVLAAQMDDLARLAAEFPEDGEIVFLLGYLHFATGEAQQAVTLLQNLADGLAEDTLARLVRDAAIRVLPGKVGEKKGL